MERIGILNQVLSLNWAMREDAFQEIIAYLQGMSDPVQMAKLMHFGNAEQLQKILTENPNAIQKMEDRDLPGSYRAEFRNNVAIIQVRGPIFPRANIMTSWSGATSISSLAVDLNAALSNDDIDTIIQNVDSPGGDITGIDDYAKMVTKARSSGKKIITFVYGQGASAAYWISASSFKLYLARTAMVGSIGVVSGYTLTEKSDEKRGIQRVEIVSSQSPKKRLNPTTDEGRAHIQSIVNGLADIFISSIATSRGVTTDKVLSDFGEGGMVLAEKAVSVGMADGITTLEEIIDSNIRSTNSFFTGGIMSITLSQVKAEAPDVYKVILDEGKTLASLELGTKVAEAKSEGITEGKALGVKAENERISKIEALSVPGAEATIKKLKFDTTQTAETVSLAIVNEQKERADKLKGDRKNSGDATASETEGLGNSSPVAEDDAEAVALQKAMDEGANGIRASR
jgi:ClpP class serine protease